MVMYILGGGYLSQTLLLVHGVDSISLIAGAHKFGTCIHSLRWHQLLIHVTENANVKFANRKIETAASH